MVDTEILIQNLSDLFGVPKNTVTNDMTMKNSEFWDSLKHMALISMVEDTYNVSLSMDDIVRMVSIQEIINVLTEKTH